MNAYDEIVTLHIEVKDVVEIVDTIKRRFERTSCEIADMDDYIERIENEILELQEAISVLESIVDDDVFGEELKRLGCPCIGCPAEDDCDIEYTDQCVSWQQWFDNLEDIPMGDADE